MPFKTRALTQTTGLLLGIGFMGFAVYAFDLTASHETKPAAPTQASAWAPRAVTPFDHTVDAATVQQKVEQFRSAMVSADTETLQSLADDNLSFGHSNGNVQSKDQFLEMIDEGTEVFNSIELTEQSLETKDDVALERHVFNADILIKGKLVKVSLGVLEVWHKRGRDWLLVARQAFKT